MGIAKCVLCELKTPPNGREICDRCSFDLKVEAQNAARGYRVLQRLKIERAEATFRKSQIRRAEILNGRNRISTGPVVRKERRHEVSYITSTGIRFGERYHGASVALDRFEYLKSKEIVGLQLRVKIGNNWKVRDSYSGTQLFPVDPED